jgi:hypothetical protein
MQPQMSCDTERWSFACTQYASGTLKFPEKLEVLADELEASATEREAA